MRQSRPLLSWRASASAGIPNDAHASSSLSPIPYSSLPCSTHRRHIYRQIEECNFNQTRGPECFNVHRETDQRIKWNRLISVLEKQKNPDVIMSQLWQLKASSNKLSLQFKVRAQDYTGYAHSHNSEVSVNHKHNCRVAYLFILFRKASGFLGKISYAAKLAC